MNRTVRSAFTLVTALALAFLALPARADDDHGRDRDRDDRHEQDRGHDRDGWHGRDRAFPAPQPPPVVYAPPPVVYSPPAAYPAPAYQPVHPARWNGGWQRGELSGEYQRLEKARANFYATWHGNPWRRDRFEAWYGARRAELDRRWSELQSWR